MTQQSKVLLFCNSPWNTNCHVFENELARKAFESNRGEVGRK